MERFERIGSYPNIKTNWCLPEIMDEYNEISIEDLKEKVKNNGDCVVALKNLDNPNLCKEICWFDRDDYDNMCFDIEMEEVEEYFLLLK